MSPEETSAAPAPGSGPTRAFRRELILFAVLLLAGLVLMPAAIYYTGQALLGEYSREGAGLPQLYGQLLGDLVAGNPAAWLLVLGPWLGIMLIRVLWWPLSPRRRGREAEPGEPAET